MELFFSLRGILMTLILIGAFGSTLINPRVGLAFIFIFSFLRDGFLFSWFQPVYDLHIPQVFIILTLVSWLMHIRKYPLRLSADVVLIFLFFLIACFSRFIAGTPVFENPVINENFRIVIIFFLVVQLIRTPKDAKALLWIFTAITLFLVLRGYYFYKTGIYELAVPDQRAASRNSFAGSLAYMLPIAYGLSKASKGKLAKFFGFFTVLWCVIGVILTYSRGGLLGILAGMFGILMTEKRKAKIIFIGLLLFFMIMPRLSEKYINRMSTIETYQEDASAMGRVATNYAAINMIKENPILGVGAGNYNDRFYEHVPPEYLKWVEPGKSVHNIVMQVTSENGIIGLAVFLSLILLGFKNSFAKIKNNTLGSEEYYEILRMLRISLFVSFLTAQFGQGAYHGNLYTILPFLAAIKQNILEINKHSSNTKMTLKNNRRRLR